jgi:hypothetical protein
MSSDPRAEILLDPTAPAAGRTRWAHTLWQWVVPLVTWVAALVLTGRGIATGDAMTPRQALAAFYMPALGFVLLGCIPSLFVARPRHRTPHWLPRGVLIALTVAVLAASVGLRLWRVTEWPPEGIGFEEFQLGGRAEMLGGPYQSLLTLYGPPGEHAFTAWATSLSFETVGQGFFELRLPFIIAGILCPFLLFAVCRRLVGWEPALFAVALFAVAWWPIAVSRAADEIFFPIWVELVLLWALIEVEDSGRAWAGFLVALTSGLLMYEYTSYHLALPVLVAYLLLRLAAFGVQLIRAADPRTRRAELAAVWRRYGAAAVTMLLVWFILANFQLLRGGSLYFAGGAAQHASDPDALIAKLATPSELPAFLVRKLLIPVQAAILPGYGELCRYTATGTMPLFDQATALCLGAAFLVTAWTWRRRMHLFALAWALAIIGGAALLPQNPNLHRYFTGMPVYFLLIALAANVIWQRARATSARGAVLAGFAALALFAAVVNVSRLQRLFDDPDYDDAWRWPRTEIIRWIRTQPRTDTFCVAVVSAGEIQEATPLSPEYRFLTRGWNVAAVESLDDCLPDPHAAHPTVHVIWAQKETPAGLGEQLQARYGPVEEQEPLRVRRERFEARIFTIPAKS